MKKSVITLLSIIGLSVSATGQSLQRAITLDEAIRIARVQSVDAAVALNELKTEIGRAHV